MTNKTEEPKQIKRDYGTRSEDEGYDHTVVYGFPILFLFIIGLFVIDYLIG